MTIERAQYLPDLIMSGVSGLWTDSRAYSSFADAISAVGSNEQFVVVGRSETIDANVIVPSNVTLFFIEGSALTIATGVTLTIYSPEKIISSVKTQIFSLVGTGTVAFTMDGTVYPGWWGAVGDGVADDGTALQNALNCGVSSLHIPAGTYMYTTKLDLAENIKSITGDGPSSTFLRPDTCIGIDWTYTDWDAWSDLLVMRDFCIFGYNDTSSSTGIGIRFYGDADNESRSIQGIRIRDVVIRGLNTAIYLRTVRDVSIDRCKFSTFNGVWLEGQVIICRCNGCDMINSNTLGTGDSCGVYIDSDTYSGVEKRPEDIVVSKSRIYGFDYGVKTVTCLLSIIRDSDLDNIKIIGINQTTLSGIANIIGNWISMGGDALSTHAIRLNPIATSQNVETNILHNRLGSADKGIHVNARQGPCTISGNTITDMLTYDIQLENVTNVNILNNMCYSDIDKNLYIASDGSVPDGVVRVAGNYFRGTMYVHPTSNISCMDIGTNQGTYSTRIIGKSTLALNATSVTTTFASLTPTPPDLTTYAVSGLRFRVIIYGPGIDLGHMWATCNETSVTINCESNSHVETDVFWEVVPIVNYH